MINPELEFRFDPEPSPGAESGRFTASWTVPASLRYLDGHFPGFPTLPGVAMMDASLEALRRASAENEGRNWRIRTAKFLRPVSPAQTAAIEFTREPNGAVWKARWKVEGVLVAEIDLSRREH